MKDLVTNRDFDEFITQLKIQKLQMECTKMDQVECPVEHEFADGLYVRKTYMPKGVFAIGKRHKYKVYNVLLEGEITVYMGPGVPVKRIKAPCTFVADAGVKKIAYFHEDTVWLNFHPTEETDLEKIENDVIIKDGDFAVEGGKLWLGLPQQLLEVP